MVIVLGIIGILLGGAISLISRLPEAAKVQRVDADFKAIGAALRTYKINAGTYPNPSRGLEALVSAPPGAAKSPRWVQMMEKLPTDPWGTPYIYKFPATKRPGDFELISAGEDRQPGTPDDLSSHME